MTIHNTWGFEWNLFLTLNLYLNIIEIYYSISRELLARSGSKAAPRSDVGGMWAWRHIRVVATSHRRTSREYISSSKLVLVCFILPCHLNSSLARVPNQLRVLTWACPAGLGREIFKINSLNRKNFRKINSSFFPSKFRMSKWTNSELVQEISTHPPHPQALPR